jgi:RHS repeat-associated protein
LVPALVQNGDNWVKDSFKRTVDGVSYAVQRYRPRIEGLFARIEKWENRKTGDVYWVSITKDNVTSVYGKNSDSKIADPDDTSRVFEWLLQETYDDKGNVILYEYKQENYDNVDSSLLYEKNRLLYTGCANTYLKRIKYGNKTPFVRGDWLFEVVLDYGEHDLGTPDVNEAQSWPKRPDAFSRYRAGFEVRVYRLCRRILMFHHFSELGNTPCLVRSSNFGYEENAVATYLVSVEQTGYIRDSGGNYQKKSLPPLEFDYTKPEIDDNVQVIDAEYLENLPMGLDGSRYQWVDLDGEGISGVLAEEGNSWFYKRNLGNAQFAPAQLVASKPSLAHLLGGQQQIMDLAGDGQKDLVLLSKSLQGFYERNNEYWESFTPFLGSPQISWNDPNLRFVDLKGDGHTDVLVTEDETFVWYPSRGEKGFGPSEMVRKFTDEERGPALVFADGTQSVYLADMTGDGLTDIVRIRNGDVCYWPSLGYGRFGAKVTMGDAPYFDHPEQFDQRRIRLADTDGSGTTDIVYLGRDYVTFWFNQAGNKWSEPHQLYTFPVVDNVSYVTVVDLYGNGTACIVWSSPIVQDADQPMCYIDLMSGKKPHLLQSIKDNMGGETILEYAPSTKFYLEDRAAGTPWVTRLHFPVQVVERVETYDYVSKTKLVNLYTYHHGYYDGEEREFRGFGLVEQLDTESYKHFYTEGLFPEPEIVEEELFVPPVYTKTWFHTGAYQDGTNISQHYSTEYYKGDPEAILLPDTVIPQKLTPQEEREACRALKGRILRQEVYALDDSPENIHPYSVSERNYQIRLMQPVQDGKYAVFFAYESEVLDYYYERNQADPRVTHKMTLEVDNYGNVTKSIVIGYPRRLPVYDEQANPLLTYTESDFTNKDSEEFYRIGVPVETRKHEITGVPFMGVPFIVSDLLTAVKTASEIPYEEKPTAGQIQKRLIECTRNLYYKDDLSGPLPLEEVESLALLYESYQMVFTPALIEQVYGDRVNDTLLEDEGKYLFWDDVWWVPSGRQIFDELHFYLPIEFIDPFDQHYIMMYDSYSLLVKKTEDPVGNTVKSENNYRTMLPEIVTGPNNNRSAVKFDELGMVVATAVMGKEEQNEGDTLDDPTTILEYDLFNYKDNGLPNYAYIKAREQHGPANPRWQESYIYSDGSGREIMKKIQAEPGLAPAYDENGDLLRDEETLEPILVDTTPNVRWVGTGRTVYDNKGNPVKKYEPFFSSIHEYEDEKDLVEWGVTPVFHYDPLGRLIQTDYPDKTFSKAEFDAWQQETWDQNDTVIESDWYNEKLPLDPTDPEGRAAQLTVEHAGTPQVVHLDVLGRTFLTIDDNGSEGQYPTHITLDIKGNQLVVTDARGNQAMVNVFDMLNQKIHSNSMDAGERWTLYNVAGNPIRAWDSRGYQIRYKYDEIQRQTHLFVQKGSDPEILAEFAVYGERHPDAAVLNMRGKIYQQYDGAGVVTNDEYDFKDNLLRNTRRLAITYKQTVDWSVLAALADFQEIADTASLLLETESFPITTAYDALNRPMSIITPDNSKTRPTYNEASLLEKVDVRLRGAAEWTLFVKNIDYNAKGQRVKIEYGIEISGETNVFTEYTYDDDTFRLINLKTTRKEDNKVLQDLNYTYDPVGNITEIRDYAQKTIFFDNAIVEPHTKYEYYALYWLKRAKGREHEGQNGNSQPNHTDVPRITVNHPNNGQAMRRYTEEYKYDEVGNILQMIHQASNGGNWTRRYEYALNSNRLLSTSLPSDPDDGPFSAKYGYDEHGNMISMPHLTKIQWDFKDQMCQVDKGGGETAYYVYDSTGQRVRKMVEKNDDTIRDERIYLGNYEIFRKHNGSGLKLERETLHIMDDQRRIVLVETKTCDKGSVVFSPTPFFRYQLNNHLGSSSMEFGDEGKIISYEEYYPYGNTSYHAVRCDMEVSLKRYRYTGKERDNETGLYYYRARYYASWLARWISCDPAGMIDGPNIYAYVWCNPVRLKDPSGTQKTSPDVIPVSHEKKSTPKAEKKLQNISDLARVIQSEAVKSTARVIQSEAVKSTARVMQSEAVKSTAKKLQNISDLARVMQSEAVKSALSRKSPGIIAAEDLKKWCNEQNISDLARVIQSEASIGEKEERIAVAYTVLNRMKRNKKDKVKDAWRGFAHDQPPVEEFEELAKNILSGKIPDNSGGATHFYSPRKMPFEGEENKEIKRLRNKHFNYFDTKGGLEKTKGLEKRNYRPGWAKEYEEVEVSGARDEYFKFYRQPGKGRVY